MTSSSYILHVSSFSTKTINDTRTGAVKETHLTVSHFLPCHSSDLQLKARHQPYKLCRQWQDLLYRFTEASEEDISLGERLEFDLLVCSFFLFL